MSQFAQVNGIQLHYIDHHPAPAQDSGTTPTLILMPGLTANASSFDGLMAAGLANNLRVIAVDLRGRGLSEKPATGYSLAEHAADIIGLLDALDLKQVIMGGHSFGGLMSFYLAHHYPERTDRLVVIDAAAAMHPNTRQMIQPSIDRLDQTLPSWEAYLTMMKNMPFFRDWWAPTIESYFRADVKTLPDGQVTPHSSAAAITEAVENVLAENWVEKLPLIKQPTLLLNATGEFGPPGSPPLLPKAQAQESVDALTACEYTEVPGNHITMLYAEGAKIISQAINQFLTIHQGTTLTS